MKLFNEQQAKQHFNEQLQFLKLDGAMLDQAFYYVLRNSYVDFQQLTQYLHITLEEADAPIQSLYVFEVNRQYYIETIYNYLERLCERKFLFQSKKLFQQNSVTAIPELSKWVQYYIKIAERHDSVDEICQTLQQIANHYGSRDLLSNRLKQLEVLVLLYSFKAGERNYNNVLQSIARLKKRWKVGKFALTIKERTLLSYVAMTIAHSRQQWKKVTDEARFLMKQDRFMDVGVELMIDYGDVLQIEPPEPTAFIKKYRTSVFESFFFMYLEALTQLDGHQEAFQLLTQYEIASTTKIFDYLQQPTEEGLIAIEAAMQQNIALLMDQSVQYMKQSLEKWQQQYKQLPEAFTSSKYMCILLETIFIAQQYELFDRLMSMYIKYLQFEQHYDCLKQRISVHITLQT